MKQPLRQAGSPYLDSKKAQTGKTLYYGDKVLRKPRSPWAFEGFR